MVSLIFVRNHFKIFESLCFALLNDTHQRCSVLNPRRLAPEAIALHLGYEFCHRCYNFIYRHDRLLYYTLIERATSLLYNDAKIMHKRNKYFEMDALKDTWGKTNDTFS